MSVRRIVLYAGLTFSLASLAFSLGSWTTQRSIAHQLAVNDARLDDMTRSILKMRESARGPDGTGGQRQPEVVAASGTQQSAMVDEIKRQLQSEMGLMPVRLLRDGALRRPASEAEGERSQGEYEAGVDDEAADGH